MTFLDQRDKQVRTETVNNKLTAMFGASSVALGRKIGLGRMTLPMTQVSKMSALVNNEKIVERSLLQRHDFCGKQGFSQLP